MMQGAKQGSAAGRPTADNTSLPPAEGTNSRRPNDDAESGSRLAEAPTPKNEHHLDLAAETLPVFFSKGVPVVDVIMATCFLAKMRLSASRTAIVYLTSFFLSMCMHAVGMSIIGSQHQVRRQGMVAYLWTVLRMLSAAALLLSLDYRVHSVAVLPPFALALALAAALSWLTFGISRDEDVGLNWGHFKKEMKFQFDLSAKVVSMASAGLSGRVLGVGYAQQQPPCSRVRVFTALAPECLLFYGLVLGLLLMLHCTVPSPIIFFRTRRRVATVYKPLLAYAALLLLVLASIVAVEDILGMNAVFFVCFVGMAIAFLYCFWGSHHHAKSVVELQQQDSLAAPNARKDQAQQCVLTAYVATLFALVMATHSRHRYGATSTAPPSWLLKCLMFWALCSILVYAVRVVVLAQKRDDDGRGSCFRAISCTTYEVCPVWNDDDYWRLFCPCLASEIC